MPPPIDFYFDFSSPYGYFGSSQIDKVAAKYNRTVVWRPYLMGAAFKLTGRKPLITIDLVADYMRIDVPRTAKLYNVEFNWPEKFPVASVAAGRTYYWLFDQDKELAKRFAQAVYHAYFVDGKDISQAGVVVEIAVSLGIDGAELEAALKDQTIKDRLRQETGNAIAKKIFGAPWFEVDGEPFWGTDQIKQVEAKLKKSKT